MTRKDWINLCVCLAFGCGELGAAPAALASGGSYDGPVSAPQGNPQIEYDAAVQLINKGEYKRAISLLKRVDERVPKNPDVLNYLGYSYRKSGDQDRGLKYYLKALDIEPAHRGANEYLGELYLEMNNLPKARERLAVLAQSCGNCAEYATLLGSVKTYMDAHPDAAPAP